MQNVIGSANCSKTDTTLCKVTPVTMSSSSSGNFLGGYDIPAAAQVPPKADIKSRPVSNSFGGQRNYTAPAATPIFQPNKTSSSKISSIPLPWKYNTRLLQRSSNTNKLQTNKNAKPSTTKSKNATKSAINITSDLP